MPRLIIPDIHEDVETLNKILKKYSHITKKTALSDWYDSFTNQTRNAIQDTTEALVDFAENDDHDLCMGNHDIQYLYPKTTQLLCSGWGAWKQEIIDPHLSLLRKKMRLFFWYTNEANRSPWFISHAGIHPSLLNPVTGMDIDYITEQCERTLEKVLYQQEITNYVAPGRIRGGFEKFGGLTWLDFREFEPIEGVNQIVGHSHDKLVRFKPGVNSQNWCIDTGLKHVAILDDDGQAYIEAV